MKKMPVKSLSFGAFKPSIATANATNTLPREAFRGLPPEAAARFLVDFHMSRKPLREVTAAQKDMVFRQIAENLAERGLDFSSVTPDDMATYREWLRALVENQSIAQSYAAHIVSSWNASIRLAFGEKGRPGESLLMRGFQQRPRQVQRFDEEEFQALVSASHRIRYRSPDDREAFQVYLELEWSTGARVGSLTPTGRRKRKKLDAEPIPEPEPTPEVEEELPEDWSVTVTVGDIDWDNGTIRLRHMKNRPEHVAILTERAVEKLRQRVASLRAKAYWRGDETPILASSTTRKGRLPGRPLTPQALNRMLKKSAAMAGIRKRTTSHVLRKSVGTHIAKHNPRFAQDQLGITAKIFEAHYNQPTLEDRLERRDILPGAVTASPRTPDEMVGQAWLNYSQGRMSRADFEAVVLRADRERAQPNVPGTAEMTGYG